MKYEPRHRESMVSPSNFSQIDSNREQYISDSQPSIRHDFKLNISTLNNTDSKCTEENLNLLEFEEYQVDQIFQEALQPTSLKRSQNKPNSVHYKPCLQLEESFPQSLELQSYSCKSQTNKFNKRQIFLKEDSLNSENLQEFLKKEQLFLGSAKMHGMNGYLKGKFNQSERIDFQNIQSGKKSKGDEFLRNEIVKLNKILKDKDMENINLKDKVESQNDLILRLEQKLFKLEEEKNSSDKKNCQFEEQIEKFKQEKEQLYRQRDKLKEKVLKKQNLLSELKQVSAEKFEDLNEQNQLLKQRIQYFQILLDNNNQILKEKDKKLENLYSKVQDISIQNANTQKEINLVRQENLTLIQQKNRSFTNQNENSAKNPIKKESLAKSFEFSSTNASSTCKQYNSIKHQNSFFSDNQSVCNPQNNQEDSQQKAMNQIQQNINSYQKDKLLSSQFKKASYNIQNNQKNENQPNPLQQQREIQQQQLKKIVGTDEVGKRRGGFNRPPLVLINNFSNKRMN